VYKHTSRKHDFFFLRRNSADLSQQSLFDQLPETLGRRATHPNIPQRKRQAETANPIVPNRGTHSSPSIDTVTDIYGNISRASTFPKAPTNATWERNPAPFPVDTLRRSSHEPYTPSTDKTGVMTPDSASSSSNLPFAQPQQGYGIPQGYGAGGGGLQDLSAMMFPSADPFAYPNQPMTTLENHHSQFGNPSPSHPPRPNPHPINTNPSIKSEHSFSSAPSDPHHPHNPNIYNNTPSTSGAPYDMSVVQLYGPLPPYLMQGQHPGMGMPGMGGVEMMMGEEWEGRTGLTPGVGTAGMEELFGEEWKRGWVEGGGFSG